MKDFEAKYAKTYSSTYSSEPSTRPSHIPQTYTSGNNSYPVYYNQQYGSYGFWDGPHWRIYEVARDAVMLNALMSNHRYEYGGPGGYGGYGYPSSSYYGHGYRYGDSGSNFFGWFIGLILILALAFVAFRILRRPFAQSR